MLFSHNLINDLRFLASKTDGEEGVCRVPQTTLLAAADEIENLHTRIAAHGREVGALLDQRDETQKRHDAIVNTLSRALNYLTRNA